MMYATIASFVLVACGAGDDAFFEFERKINRRLDPAFADYFVSPDYKTAVVLAWPNGAGEPALYALRGDSFDRIVPYGIQGEMKPAELFPNLAKPTGRLDLLMAAQGPAAATLETLHKMAAPLTQPAGNITAVADAGKKCKALYALSGDAGFIAFDGGDRAMPLRVQAGREEQVRKEIAAMPAQKGDVRIVVGQRGWVAAEIKGPGIFLRLSPPWDALLVCGTKDGDGWRLQRGDLEPEPGKAAARAVPVGDRTGDILVDRLVIVAPQPVPIDPLFFLLKK